MSVFRVRTEGRRYNVTEDTIDVKNIIVGFSFYKDSPTIIDVHIEKHIRLPDGGTSGVFSKDTRIDSQTYNAGNSYRITSTGLDTCTVSNPSYTAPAAASDLTHTVSDTDLDDQFRVLNIPWNTTFLGRSYKGSEVFLCTNTYLTFGTGYTTIALTATDPPVPKLSIGNADNRMTLIKSDSPAITTVLGAFDMTKTFGDSPFTITQPSSDSPGAFTYSVTAGSDIISMSGNTITVLKAGSATVQASQAASGNYLAATKTATITINRATPTLVTSQTTFYRKFVSGATVSFNDVISSNAGTVPRTHVSNNTAVVTIPTAATPSASIAGPGKTTIKVTQPATTNYTEIIDNDLITIVVVGQGKTYTSEIFPSSFDLSGTNLSNSTFTDCTFTSTNLFGVTVDASTNFSASTFTGIGSGRITGKTARLPVGFTMI